MFQGLVREVIISDGGSSDATSDIADVAGAKFIRGQKGRGVQFAAGAGEARSSWLLFLHGDTVLQPGWEREAAAFMERVDGGTRPLAAAAFSFALDDFGARPRMLEAIVALRCALLRFPYGDQGLLIPKRLYQSVGGYRPLPLMEDVDLVRRLGRNQLVMMRASAGQAQGAPPHWQAFHALGSHDAVLGPCGYRWVPTSYQLDL